MSGKVTRSPIRFRQFFLAACMIAGLGLAAISLASPNPAFADAGGFPTATPTITPTWTPTIPLTATPTVTVTPLASITLVGLLPVQATIQPSIVVTAEVIPETGGSLFACWPLAIVFLLVGVILAAYLLTRRTRLEAEE
jgi:hypothetical protein